MNEPTVTVVMPVRNEGAFIAKSLQAVLEQEYPRDRLEVLVADGMSTDQTRNIVQSLQQQYPFLRLLDNPGHVVPTGFNAAVRQARGDIIVRVDGHTIIAPDYVRNCVKELEQSQADNVGGRMDAVAEGAFGRAAALATSSPFGVGGARFHYAKSRQWVDTVYLGAWPRRVFHQVGLFDEEQVRNQDDEFNYRLRAHGGRILLSPLIKSHYYNRATPQGLWRQYFQYGYWKVRVMQKHPRQMRPRQFVPVLLILCVATAAVAAVFNMAGAYLLGLTLAAYCLANFGATSLAADRTQPAATALLPVAFMTLHFAYGCGFLVGLLRFCRRWKDSTPRAPALAEPPPLACSLTQ